MLIARGLTSPVTVTMVALVVIMERLHFSCNPPIFRENPRGRICTKFGIAIGFADVITCDEFFVDRLRGVDSVVVEFCYFP